MTWARLDDRFHSHPKIESAGFAAIGLYAIGLSYAACHETDGQLPEGWVRRQRASRHVKTLLEIGLWERTEGGYLIPDFLDFNPSKEELLSRRAEDAKRQREWRASRGLSQR